MSMRFFAMPLVVAICFATGCSTDSTDVSYASSENDVKTQSSNEESDSVSATAIDEMTFKFSEVNVEPRRKPKRVRIDWSIAGSQSSEPPETVAVEYRINGQRDDVKTINCKPQHCVIKGITWGERYEFTLLGYLPNGDVVRSNTWVGQIEKPTKKKQADWQPAPFDPQEERVSSGSNDSYECARQFDADCDGMPNEFDYDADNDGLPNDFDWDPNGDGIPFTPFDRDEDGVPNEFDRDMDGDLRPNTSDWDMDGDQQDNSVDSDIDGDGMYNQFDSDPFQPDF